jgi:hypothetical protein
VATSIQHRRAARELRWTSLLEADCVDTVEPAVIPVLLGGGVPLLPPPSARHRLSLVGHQVYEKSGIVLMRYDVVR